MDWRLCMAPMALSVMSFSISEVTWTDVRREYGEMRMAGIGYIGQRLFYVVFVDRVDGRRVISLRKANVRVVKRYAET